MIDNLCCCILCTYTEIHTDRHRNNGSHGAAATCKWSVISLSVYIPLSSAVADNYMTMYCAMGPLSTVGGSLEMLIDWSAGLDDKSSNWYTPIWTPIWDWWWTVQERGRPYVKARTSTQRHVHRMPPTWLQVTTAETSASTAIRAPLNGYKTPVSLCTMQNTKARPS